jgi:hypothetical protein
MGLDTVVIMSLFMLLLSGWLWHSSKLTAALTELGSTLSTTLTQHVREGYASNPFCQSLQIVLPLRKDCIKHKGLLFINGRIVISSTPSVRCNIIDDAHQQLGHLGYLKTVAEVRRNFFWPHLERDVAQAVQTCNTCQRTKAPTLATPGRMLTPSFLRRPLQELAIDFVRPLMSALETTWFPKSLQQCSLQIPLTFLIIFIYYYL